MATSEANRIARRHVLDLDDFTRLEIEELLDSAVGMKEILKRDIAQVPTLRGVTVVNMFFEDSTRTRISFELAAKALSANVVNFASRGSSVEKGESLLDTMRTLQALGADILVVRHPQAGAPYLLAQHFHGGLINAGDGRHAHPTQALLDLFTLRERLGTLDRRHIVIVGDILHSRVARSNLWGLTALGAQVTLCAPPTLLGNEQFWLDTWPDVRIVYNLDAALQDADAVILLRLQRERQESGLLPSLREYSQFFALSEERLRRAPAGLLVLHPGPINEGVEIAPTVATAQQSLIETQVTNGVAVRMALLYHLAIGQRQKGS